MNRRKLLKRAAQATLAAGITGTVYGLLEAKWCRLNKTTISLPNLPAPFEGTTIALLTDVHHGPYVPRGYVRSIVEMTNALKSDLVALSGDYVHKDRCYIAPAVEELGKLRARLGRFAVLGNHDHWESAEESRAALADARITEVTNSGVWLERGGSRLRIAGVGDLWSDRQDVNSALGDASITDAVLLLSHNPDYVETLDDKRVGLVLSGHTHGGQVVLPGFGAPMVPSKYGQKYLRGLVQGPTAKVYVSKGVGTITPPIRFLCRPEVVLLTLTRAALG